MNILVKESTKLFFYTGFLFYLPLYFYFCVSSRVYDLSSFFYSFVRWDSGWYLQIAQNGYPQNISQKISTNDLVYLWPPLYSLILKIVTALSPFSVGTSVFLLQNIIIFGVIYTTLKLLNLFLDFKKCKKIVLLFLMFPISVFFYSAYSEGLFLIFLNLFIYFLIKKEYSKAALLGSLLPVIRYVGIFVIFILNFFVIFFSIKKNKSFELSQVIKLVGINIIFLTPFIFWILFNYSNTADPLFFLTVKDSNVAFLEWGKYKNPFYFYFFKWLNILFNGKPNWIEYKLAGLFVILYCWMNIETLRTEVKDSLKFPLKVLSFFGIFFVVFPFTTGIESLWRYGYIFPLQFISLNKVIKNDFLYNFLLILFACLKISFGIAFISSLHIT